MGYVITDGTNYAFIDVTPIEVIGKRYPMLSKMYKTKFLAKARPYRTRKEAEVRVKRLNKKYNNVHTIEKVKERARVEMV